jgi:hypothetical protein
MDPGLYQQRPPIDLGNARLRKLAAALAPSYMRVSGTWANNTYFHDSDTRAPSTAPEGFGGVLTRPQWKGVVDFSHAVDAKLVTSFATSPVNIVHPFLRVVDVDRLGGNVKIAEPNGWLLWIKRSFEIGSQAPKPSELLGVLFRRD